MEITFVDGKPGREKSIGESDHLEETSGFFKKLIRPLVSSSFVANQLIKREKFLGVFPVWWKRTVARCHWQEHGKGKDNLR
jgi:hypothetical protein